MPKYLLKFVNHVTIKLWMWNTLSQKRFQVTFILTYKRKISLIELRECFLKLIKSVTLFQKFFCDRLITNMEIFNRGTGPSKTDKLWNVKPVRCSTRNISIQMRIINYSEIKIVPFVVSLRRNNPIIYGKI